MIIGVGADIVEIKRIKKIWYKFGNKFEKKILSPEEIKHLNTFSTKEKKVKYLSNRLAAKEAVSKALGKGIGLLQWRDIIILRNSFGQPQVKIKSNKIISNIQIYISISDSNFNSIAFAIITKIYDTENK